MGFLGRFSRLRGQSRLASRVALDSTAGSTPETPMEEIPSLDRAGVGLKASFQRANLPREDGPPILPDKAIPRQHTAITKSAIGSKRRQIRLTVLSDKIRKTLGRESKIVITSAAQLEPKTAFYSQYRSLSFSMSPVLENGLVSEQDYDSDAEYISTPKPSDYKTYSMQSALTRLQPKLTESHGQTLSVIVRDNEKPDSHRDGIGNACWLDTIGTFDGTDLDILPQNPQTTAAISEQIPDGDIRQCILNSAEELLSFHSANSAEEAPELNISSSATPPCSFPRSFSGMRQTQGAIPLEISQNRTADMTSAAGSGLRQMAFQCSVDSALEHHRPSSTCTELESRKRSIHLYDMSISQRLASPSMLPDLRYGHMSLLSYQPQVSVNNVHPQVDAFLESHESAALKTAIPATGICQRRPSIIHSPTVSPVYSPAGSDSHLPLNPSRFAYTKAGIIMPRVRPVTKYHFHESLVPEQLPVTQFLSTRASTPELRTSSSVVQRNPTQSKFKEQFEISGSVDPGLPHEDQCTTTSRKVSVGWMSGGRRIGYGYTFVSDGKDQSLTSQMISSTPMDSGLKSESEGMGEVRKDMNNPMTDSSTVGPLRDSLTETPSHILDCCLGKDNQTDIDKTKISGQTPSKSSRISSLWTRFPSHTRAERNGSASIHDNILVRDFGTDELVESDAQSKSRKLEISDVTVIKKRRRIFQPWIRAGSLQEGKTMKCQSSPAAGIPQVRLSKVPWLDISQLTPHKEELERSLDAQHKMRKIYFPEDATGQSEAPQNEPAVSQHRYSIDENFPGNRLVSDEPSVSEGTNGRLSFGAQEWSRMYKECVDSPAGNVDEDQRTRASWNLSYDTDTSDKE